MFVVIIARSSNLLKIHENFVIMHLGQDSREFHPHDCGEYQHVNMAYPRDCLNNHILVNF
jgi:hypothetical protein